MPRQLAVPTSVRYIDLGVRSRLSSSHSLWISSFEESYFARKLQRTSFKSSIRTDSLHLLRPWARLSRFRRLPCLWVIMSCHAIEHTSKIGLDTSEIGAWTPPPPKIQKTQIFCINHWNHRKCIPIVASTFLDACFYSYLSHSQPKTELPDL